MNGPSLVSRMGGVSAVGSGVHWVVFVVSLGCLAFLGAQWRPSEHGLGTHVFSGTLLPLSIVSQVRFSTIFVVVA